MLGKIKDSGVREQFDSGMVRDTADGKTDYTLVLDGPMFQRWADHLTNGAKKYDKRNWMKASGPSERDRFRESALRHFIQWYRGETNEDHAAAVFFNVNGVEYVESRPKTSHYPGEGFVDKQKAPEEPIPQGASYIPDSVRYSSNQCPSCFRPLYQHPIRLLPNGGFTRSCEFA